MIATEMKTTRRHIITGGPGSGKSTLIEALEARGQCCYREVSRELIRHEARRPNGVMPWNDLEAFARLAFAEMLLQHDHAAEAGERCFFDRGLPDIFGYLRQSGLDIPARYLEAHARCRYERTVFILPPWPEIYVNDAERPQTLAEATALHDAIRAVYESLGYDLVEVPKAPVDERCEFVLETLGRKPEKMDHLVVVN
ncbi:MAG: AAA family ATPase [Chlorobiaceae bacterium]|nr:AAA family ATPase [Chlorobiaceae bacterium]